MHVIIIDDQATNRELCRYMLSGIARQIETFENGVGVVEAIRNMSVMPDVILLDVMMPEKDGFTTASEIRKEFVGQHLPIIFLTVLDDHDSFERCLSLGDDFILKPVDRSVLVAKVLAHCRIARMHKELKTQRDQLCRFRDQVQYDYTIAESIFSNLMDRMSCKASNIYGLDYLSTPSTVFNGDVILVANRPHGGVYVMIADATGHGLPAAISAIPASRAFFAMVAKGLSLGDIVLEMNNALYGFLPMGMMLAASVFEVRANGFEVSWWGGGLPDGYIVGPDGSILRHLVSTHMPLGVLKPNEFEADIVHLKMAPGQQILCYTDGVIEAQNQEGEQFGQERLEQVILQGKDMIPNLFDSVKQFANKTAGDDLSILSMEFPISNSNQVTLPSEQGYLSSVPTHTTLHFDAGLIQQVALMNQVRQFLSGLFYGDAHLDLVCSLLSELFANAIDHGLLNLDSKIKENPDGFFQFYQMREEKLQQLDPHAWLRLDIDFLPQKHQIIFQLEHNGKGFDYHKVVSASESMTHGRGIVLATELCDKLQYSKQGKCVEAIYNFDTQHRFPSSQ
ncbi:Serine phosphatase RsbU, regulator of sigma subunit [Vibrio xiamenensis]|uniref:Serine phosphatase RsbU, regulator of sigma subunit n=1 Tax=Vibrio xiamenensis TaxID=861298 RepID=A0A1G7XEZ0_9VIBR|nr:SpoIIE family protein phosphatase [Vibrio xiamenensis]SDG82835.1 Serine phosphatase RsbU, regulator of sigma subunit [Vibrio xiamenensis]